MLVFKSILNSDLTDKQILFQLARINSWISLNGKIANSYKSKINIDFRGLTNNVMTKLGFEPNTIIKNTVETDPTIFQADNKCGVKYPYVSAPDDLLLDTKLNPAQKVLLLILKEVWLDNNDKQLLPYCQTETIFKQIPNYKHTRDYINKLILSLQEKGYISFDTIKNHGRVNVRISFDGSLKNAKEELSNQISAEDEIKEMVHPVQQLDNDVTKLIAEMKKEIDGLKEQVKEIPILKEQVNKLQEELNERRGIEKSDIERSIRNPEQDRECAEATENTETVGQSDKSRTESEVAEDTENTENTETVGQNNRNSTETAGQSDKSRTVYECAAVGEIGETIGQIIFNSNKTDGQSDKTESENNGVISLRNDPTDSEQLDDADDMDFFMSLIPEVGEYSQEEIEAVKNDKEPTMKQRKAECSADSLFNLANDIDFKMLMKDVNEDIKSSREHRSNIWRSAKKDEYQNHIKELKSESKKEEITEYIINTVNEKNSRILINSLDEVYYKITMGIVKKNQDRITNVYYKNVGDFEIHQSTLDEFVA